MERVYHRFHGGYSYEIKDKEAYERFWQGKRPSSREAFEAWFFDPFKTQHQIFIEYGKQNVGYNIRELMKADIISRFKREDYDKSKEGETRKRRREMDIYAEILYITNEGGVNKTAIVYQANLNFMSVEKHLSALLKGELIEVDADKCYRTTDKGVQYLHHYEEIENLGMRDDFEKHRS